jgi:hypothetical protein
MSFTGFHPIQVGTFWQSAGASIADRVALRVAA